MSSLSRGISSISSFSKVKGGSTRSTRARQDKLLPRSLLHFFMAVSSNHNFQHQNKRSPVLTDATGLLFVEHSELAASWISDSLLDLLS